MRCVVGTDNFVWVNRPVYNYRIQYEDPVIKKKCMADDI